MACQISHRTRVRTKIALLALTILLTISVIPVRAQQTLSDADWFERELGKGVLWRYYHFEQFNGFRQSISYIEVDLNSPGVSVEFPYLADSRQRSSSMIGSQYPDSVAGMNGTYFATSGSGGHVTYLRIDGTEIPPGGGLFAPFGYEAALALDGEGNPTIIGIPDGGWSNNATHPNIMACGPLLIREGMVLSDHLASLGSHSTSRHPRSAVGLTSDNKMILITVDGRTGMATGMSCEELAQVMKDLGCIFAMNMDGGGSTTLWGAGEMYDGVLNYPSDNGVYDHLGQRACSNSIAIIAGAAEPGEWDARLTEKCYSQMMENEAQQTVSLTYLNIGTETWTADETKLVLSRPESRTSAFYDSASWLSSSQPASMSPEIVAPGESSIFTFIMRSQDVSVTTVYDEHFMLTQSGIGRIGPADTEALMKIAVQPPVTPEETFIVESRAGGQNSGWYSDSGMANSGTNCTTPGCMGNIGTRYGSTYRSVAGSKKATVAPVFPDAGFYKVYVTWGAGSSRRNPVTYHVNHSKGTETFQLDQIATANEWVQLGTSPYYFEKGTSGSVEMTNEDIDVSGSMYAAAVKFEYAPPEEPDKTYEVNYLDPGIAKPIIDGQISVGEWESASPAATGYVHHDDPSVAAMEYASFQVLYDDSYLYIHLQMDNGYLAGYTTPPDPPGYYDLGGDKFNFFFTPLGVYSEPFYRVVFCPNPEDGNCYVWSQASMIKTSDGTAGTDWTVDVDVAHTFVDGRLLIESRILWSTFNHLNIDLSLIPEDGDIWGVQSCITNELSAGIWEYVNWEPDGTPLYVMGEPFGALAFNRSTGTVNSWIAY